MSRPPRQHIARQMARSYERDRVLVSLAQVAFTMVCTMPLMITLPLSRMFYTCLQEGVTEPSPAPDVMFHGEP